MQFESVLLSSFSQFFDEVARSEIGEVAAHCTRLSSVVD